MDLNDLPQNVQDAFKKYDDAGWQGNVSGQTQGTNAGRKWGNRDGERFIVGSDGSVWYTDSHYGQGESLTWN